MRPLLIPLAERLGRYALARQGITSSHVMTSLGGLHLYDAVGRGKLPPVVVLHGIASTATSFGPLLAHLHRDFRRIVAPDYPGHGFSAHDGVELRPRRLFERVASALDETLDEPAIVVGNSLGGALAIRYAFERPERVRALVLLSPGGARCSDDDWAAIRETFNVTSRSKAQAFLQRLYHRRPWFAPIVAHEVVQNIGARAVREVLEAASNDDTLTGEELGTIAAPILFLWGQSERILPATHFEYYAKHLPRHAVIERPEGFGHCPHMDQPGKLARRIATFVRSHVLGRTHTALEGGA